MAYTARSSKWAARSAPIPPKEVATSARAIVTGLLLPESIRATAQAVKFYQAKHNLTHLWSPERATVDECLMCAEESLASLLRISQGQVAVPAMSLPCLQSTAEVLRSAEERAKPGDSDPDANG